MPIPLKTGSDEKHGPVVSYVQCSANITVPGIEIHLVIIVAKASRKDVAKSPLQVERGVNETALISIIIHAKKLNLCA